MHACAVTLSPDALCWYVINVILRQHFDVGGYEANRYNCGQTTSTTATRRVQLYEKEKYPDRSGPDLYRVMRGYPRMGSGDRCGLQFRDPGSDYRAVKERPRIIYLSGEELRYLFKGLRILIGVCCFVRCVTACYATETW